MNALASKAVRLAVAAAVALLAATPESDAAMSRSMPGPDHTIAYVGKPDLALTAALVQAGGGATNFNAGNLVAFLAGPNASAEMKHLNAEFGPQETQASVTAFTYAVDDALRIATKAGVKLPPPHPSLAQRRAIVRAMYHDGINSHGVWDVGYMLDHLLSHPIHDQVMHDIDHRPGYGQRIDYNFHVVLTQAMYDLHAAYHL